MRMRHRVTGVVLEVPDGAVEDYLALGYRDTVPATKPKSIRRRKVVEDGASIDHPE